MNNDSSAQSTAFGGRLSWSTVGSNYDFGRPFPPEQVVRLVLSDSPLEGDKERSVRIFEPGIGTGRIIVPLAQEQPNWNFAGCDKSQPMLDALAAKLERDGISNIDFANGDVQTYRPEVSPDYIILSSLLHSIPEWKGALQHQIDLLSEKMGMMCVIGEEADLYNEALGREPQVIETSPDLALSTFWSLYRQARKNVDAPSTEASQVGCKWNIFNSEIDAQLRSWGALEVSKATIEWEQKATVLDLMEIVERRCYSSMFTVEDGVYARLVNQLKNLCSDAGLEMNQQVGMRFMAHRVFYRF